MSSLKYGMAGKIIHVSAGCNSNTTHLCSQCITDIITI